MKRVETRLERRRRKAVGAGDRNIDMVWGREWVVDLGVWVKVGRGVAVSGW